MIWALFFLALVPLLLLLFAGGAEDDSEADPVAHYKRQLEEIEDDLKNGVLSKEAAAGAVLEIERRILSLADNQEGQIKGGRSGLALPAVVAGLLVAGTALGYSLMGSPDAPSKPGQVVGLLDQAVTDDGPTYGEAIDKLTAHLADNPDDKQGWEVLATSSRSVQSYAIAANALQNLIRLDPAQTRWRIQQLEIYIAMARGRITPAANMLIQGILKAEPQHPAGHYYLGLSRLQSGDNDAAEAIWTALADRSPANAPWMPTVRQQLGALGVTPPTLTQDEMQRVAEMDAEEQDEFVKAMIDRLAARLESNPADAEGWMMLARSQAAIGEKDAAIEALTRAMGLVDANKRPQLQAFLDNLRESPNP